VGATINRGLFAKIRNDATAGPADNLITAFEGSVSFPKGSKGTVTKVTLCNSAQEAVVATVTLEGHTFTVSQFAIQPGGTFTIWIDLSERPSEEDVSMALTATYSGR
jgi:hypothetical protein